MSTEGDQPDGQETALVEAPDWEMVERRPVLPSPGLPSLREVHWMAKALSSAVTLPNALRGKPADVLAVMLAGRELGIGPMASTRMVHIINGQTSIATELKLALAKQAGHEIITLSEGPGWCVAGCATHPEGGCYGWKMEADLEAPEYPGLTGWTIASQIMMESWEGPSGNRRKTEAPMTDKSNWKAYGRNMLWWRSAGDFMRRHCPGVGGGIYTLEELGHGSAAE